MLDRLTPYIGHFDLDERLVSSVKNRKKPLLVCYPYHETTIVAGRSSKIEKEIRLDKAVNDGIPIQRRKGGGCAVVLSPGNLIVCVSFPARGFLNIGPLFRRSTQWLVRGLHRIGFKDVYQDGISDIVIQNRKVGGTCFYRTKGVAYFSASLLVNADLTLIPKYLHMPPRQPDYRNNRQHSDFVFNLVDNASSVDAKHLSKELLAILNPDELSEPGGH